MMRSRKSYLQNSGQIGHVIQVICGKVSTPTATDIFLSLSDLFAERILYFRVTRKLQECPQQGDCDRLMTSQKDCPGVDVISGSVRFCRNLNQFTRLISANISSSDNFPFSFSPALALTKSNIKSASKQSCQPYGEESS